MNPIYYMRDNHTFRDLSDDVDTALMRLGEELAAGYTGGMLCTHRAGISHLHAPWPMDREQFKRDARSWLLRALHAESV